MNSNKLRFFFLFFVISICGCAIDYSSPANNETRLNFKKPEGFNTIDYFFDEVGGVTWRKCDIGTNLDQNSLKCVGNKVYATWPEAVAIVSGLNDKNYEGHNDWRLPSRFDLSNLLLNNQKIKQIAHIKHYRYSMFSPSEWIAYYKNGRQITFTRYQKGEADAQCEAARDTLQGIFGNFLGIDPNYRSFVPDTEKHRWLADNYSWSERGKTPPEMANWQNPSSIDYQNICGNIVAAFFEDNEKDQVTNAFRPHAKLPIQIVRGGNNTDAWSYSINSMKNSNKVIQLSKQKSEAEKRAIGAFYGGILAKIPKGTHSSSENFNYKLEANKGSKSWQDDESYLLTCTSGRKKGSEHYIQHLKRGGYTSTYEVGIKKSIAEWGEWLCK